MEDSKMIVEKIERIFDILNKEYFESVLEKPIFTIEVTKNAYGHMSVGKRWQEIEGVYEDGKRELNINPEYLNRSLPEIVTTILHEMCHLHNIMNDIEDCKGYYHNKHYKKEAERVGLIVSKGTYGWNITKPSEETRALIKKHNIEEFKTVKATGNIFRPVTKKGEEETGEDESTGKPKKVRKKTSTRKYQCSNCGNSVRATKDLKVICGECYILYYWEEPMVLMD